MTRWVVFVQNLDKSSRVERVVGPFASYDLARGYLDKRNASEEKDQYFFGIRELEPTQIERMS